MSRETSDSSSDGVTDAVVQGMVAALRPNWHVESIKEISRGTDFIARLNVQTPAKRAVVLKATTADFVDPVIARSEPRLLTLVGRETAIPVPEVFGYCDDHERYPAPFYLMEYVDGENYEGQSEALSGAVRERLLREAGQNLAELHEIGPLPAAGKIGVQNGELTVLDTDEHPRFEDCRERVLSECEETLESLTKGGFFPELADDPSRFADLVPAVREYLHDRVPALPAPDPPTYCHWDYRLGNLLIEPETGETQAVLDWANLSSAEPAYNLAQTEFYLLTPEADDLRRTSNLREKFRTAYTQARTGWSLDEPTRERMSVYRLASRLGAMACLPLWYQDASAETRDKRAQEHRAFVEQYL